VLKHIHGRTSLHHQTLKTEHCNNTSANVYVVAVMESARVRVTKAAQRQVAVNLF